MDRREGEKEGKTRRESGGGQRGLEPVKWEEKREWAKGTKQQKKAGRDR